MKPTNELHMRRESDRKDMSPEERHELEIELMKRDLLSLASNQTVTNETLDRLDTLIQQLSQLLQLHEQRITNTETAQNEKFSVFMETFKEQNSQLRSLERDLQNYIHQTDLRIRDAQDSMQKTMQETISNVTESISVEISDIKKFQYKLFGGLIVVAFAIELFMKYGNG